MGEKLNFGSRFERRRFSSSLQKNPVLLGALCLVIGYFLGQRNAVDYYSSMETNDARPASFAGLDNLRDDNHASISLLEEIHKLEKHKYQYRIAMAETYLKGYGVEIGAKSSPQQMPPGAISLNVDHMSTEDLIIKYDGPAKENKKWIEGIKQNPVMRVDDAETLKTFEANSLDFIVANHVLEHVSNFMGTLEVFARKLRIGGIVFIALPDKRFVPEDAHRPITSPTLFLEELADKSLSQRRRPQKILECYLHRIQPKGGTFSRETRTKAEAEARKDKGGAHIHTFTTESLSMTMAMARMKRGFPLQLVAIQQVGNENIMILRKLDEFTEIGSGRLTMRCYASSLSKTNDPNCPADVKA